MELKAIIVQGGTETAGGQEHWVGHALSSLEVLGKPVIEHVAERLQRFGVDGMTLVTSEPVTGARSRKGPNVVTAAAAQVWRAAETVFNLYAQTGAEIVIVMRVGPYVEFDLDMLLHFHHEKKNRVTRVVDANGRPLEIAVIDASRRNDAAVLLRSGLKEMRSAAEDFRFSGYVNPLHEIGDVRRLAQDALTLDCEIRPDGEQIKPGVWVGEGADVAKDARLVAPCFVGAKAKIHSGVVITRMAAVERNAEVDLGTMVEDSSILPLSYVGPGLDICHSIVGHSKIANLPRNATVTLCDPKLTAELSPSLLVRKVGALAEVIGAAASSVIGSITAKHSAAPAAAGEVEHATLAEKTRAAAKAS